MTHLPYKAPKITKKRKYDFDSMVIGSTKSFHAPSAQSLLSSYYYWKTKNHRDFVKITFKKMEEGLYIGTRLE